MGSSIEIKQKYDHNYSAKSQLVLAIVLFCNVIVLILMSIAICSSYWITTSGYRQGILFLCIEERDSNSPGLPFDLDKEEDLAPGCYPNRDVAYLRVCLFLSLICNLSSLAGAFFTGYTIKARGSEKINWLKLAICTTLVTIICDMALVIVYPIQFAKEIDNQKIWFLDVSYGAACGCAILATGQLILLIAVLRRITITYRATRI